MTRYILLLFTWVLMTAAASAEVIVEKAWVRQPPPVAETAAGYMTLSNSGDAAVEITAAGSDVSATAEIHAMRMQGDMMHMQHLSKVTIPARGTLELSPGGMHLMLLGLKHPLQADQRVKITLYFADGGRLDIQAPVRDMRKRHRHESHEESHHGFEHESEDHHDAYEEEGHGHGRHGGHH
ncbi:MAG: copper chaperone PCu(A)C [Mariprofundaceae bacterium]